MSKLSNKFALMVLGPPASGKGTQAELLAKEYGFHHIISSEVGRRYMATHNDPQTLRQKERYDKGLVFEPDWTFKMISEEVESVLNENHECPGILFDGSPRTLYEAEHLYQFVVDLVGKENLKVVVLNVSESDVKVRVKNRLVCTESSKHVFTRSDDLCSGDSCPEGDGVLKERDIDSDEIIGIRLETYKKETVPGIEFLKKVHEVLEINGEQSVEKVHEDILKALGI